ncbi:MAG: hypothetical protein NDI61_12850 [Bdellovibrionaceae bacterium]|nr:hypothetical protein [Pseudobdellovibrionaceae bacterium]
MSRFLFLLMLVVSAGCGQQVNSVVITPRDPRTTPSTSQVSFIANIELQGTTTARPSSSSLILVNHTAGGSAQRTSSTSTSFRLSSGIGVD